PHRRDPGAEAAGPGALERGLLPLHRRAHGRPGRPEPVPPRAPARGRDRGAVAHHAGRPLRPAGGHRQPPDAARGPGPAAARDGPPRARARGERWKGPEVNRERRDMDEKKTGTLALKTGLAEMLKGGVIMDVTTDAQARIAEDAGAVAVMALERVPADIRRDGGVARMADPAIVERIMAAVSIPVMAKCRIGHFAEARVLESLGVDYIDESEVLTPADDEHHVDKHAFAVPFVCGCRDLGEALRRIGEGAALLRTKGEEGTGDIREAVR